MNVERLAQVFVEVADTLGRPFDLLGFLRTLTERAAQYTGSAVGLMLASPGDLDQVAASTDEALTLELFQVQHVEGPGIDVCRTGRPVSSADLTRENGRWPHFAPKAVETGVLAVHAFPMRLREQQIGAINAFSDTPGDMLATDAVVIQALADVATIGLIQEARSSNAEAHVDQLQHALNSRIIIEQAKGVLSHALGVEVNEAFETMRRHARHNGLKLTDLAQDVIRHPTTIQALRG